MAVWVCRGVLGDGAAEYYLCGKLTRYKITAEVTLFDSRCGMHAEWGDARAGNTGNTGNTKKKLGASLNGSLGLLGRWGDGRQSAEPPNRSDLSDLSDLSDKNACYPQLLANPVQTPTSYKTTAQVLYL